MYGNVIDTLLYAEVRIDIRGNVKTALLFRTTGLEARNHLGDQGTVRPIMFSCTGPILQIKNLGGCSRGAEMGPCESIPNLNRTELGLVDASPISLYYFHHFCLSTSIVLPFLSLSTCFPS